MTFRKEVTGTIARQLAGIVVGFLLITIIARTLGPKDNGIYALVILFPTLLSTLLNCGLTASIAYFLSRKDIAIEHAVSITIQWCTIFSLIGLLFGASLIIWFRQLLFPHVSTMYLWLGLLSFPFVLLQSILPGILQGLREFAILNLVTLVPMIVNIVCVIVGFAYIPDHILVAVLSFMIGVIFGNLLLMWRLKILLKENIKENQNSLLSNRHLFGYGLVAHASNVLTFTNYRTDFYIISQLLGGSSAGIYVSAVQIVERIWIVAQSISYVLLPHLAGESNQAVVKHRTLMALRASVIATIIISGLLVLLGAKVIPLFFGSMYTGVYPILIWLVPGIIMGSVSKVISNSLAARGYTIVNLTTAAVILLFNISMSLYLTRKMGLYGAALSTSLSYVMDGIIKLIVFHRIWMTQPSVPMIGEVK